LMELLTTMAARQGLVPGVHPGYRSMGRANEDPSPAAGG
jgi:hypothetical protein